MPYTTLQALSDRYGDELLIDLTDRSTPRAGAVDAEVVSQAIADADAMIDGYLAGLYALPLPATPPVIGALCRAITIYNLHSYQAPEKIEADYRDALRQLEQIARGLIKIEAPGIEIEDTGGGGARVTDRERPMTQDNLKGFI